MPHAQWGHLLLTNMQALQRIEIVDLLPGKSLWWLDGSAEGTPESGCKGYVREHVGSTDGT